MNVIGMPSPWWEREEMVGKKPFLLKVRKGHENGQGEGRQDRTRLRMKQ